MLFRDDNDGLVEIRKHNFTTDTAYYMAIMKVKQSVYRRHTSLNMYGDPVVRKEKAAIYHHPK